MIQRKNIFVPDKRYPLWFDS